MGGSGPTRVSLVLRGRDWAKGSELGARSRGRAPAAAAALIACGRPARGLTPGSHVPLPAPAQAGVNRMVEPGGGPCQGAQVLGSALAPRLRIARSCGARAGRDRGRRAVVKRRAGCAGQRGGGCLPTGDPKATEDGAAPRLPSVPQGPAPPEAHGPSSLFHRFCPQSPVRVR